MREQADHEPIPASDARTVEQLAHLVPALWRTMRRATDSFERLPANESQVTLLRMIAMTDGISPSQLAERLHLARPTVSNLLKGLTHAGLVERRTADGNNRSAVVSATALGHEVLETFRHDRADVLQSALARLSPADQHRIEAAVYPLRLLLLELEDTVQQRPQLEEESA
ncbi:MAG: MarR family transcriptional regulator [Microbacterium sp.]|uniref:MarR family winged helix-turn-helix transcriptional regulator n=1 Tax=Microbacterium sp. TaxID=51671 RepID=UPI0039E64406